MQNSILFQSVTNSDGEFGSQRQKKLKNKRNLIHANEFIFQKIKIFLRKNSSSKLMKKRRRCRIQFSFKLSRIEMENFWVNPTRDWKMSRIAFVKTNSAFRKLKFFLSKVLPQSRTRKGGDAELNSLSSCDKFRWTIWVSTAEETEK